MIAKVKKIRMQNAAEKPNNTLSYNTGILNAEKQLYYGLFQLVYWNG